MSSAVIVGSGGQDGRILYDRLLRAGYSLLGIERRGARGTGGIDLSRVDILDREQVFSAVSRVRPDEVYYLAAHHRSSEEEDMGESLDLYEASHQAHVLGLLHFLEAARRLSPSTRVFYAASSRIFGDRGGEADESAPLEPTCIYGITKACGVHCCRFFRQTYGLHVSVGILYNHESPLRRPTFVSQRIIRSARDIRRGTQSRLILGDLSATADWGYAPDFVEAMVRIVGLEKPGDFVVATGEAHTVMDFVNVAFDLAGLPWEKYVEEDPPRIARRGAGLVGNAAKLRALTGWKPTVSFEEMIRILWRIACDGDDDR